MARLIAARLASAAATLVVVTIVVFLLLSALPGDPTVEDESPRPLPAEYRAALRSQYHLDRPLPVRYARWIGDLARGDLGRSFAASRPVTDLLAERLPRSLALNALALMVMLCVALPLGILGAWRPRGLWDVAGGTLATALYAVPVFWMALLLQLLFAVRLGWLPLSGVVTEGGPAASRLAHAADLLRHAVLPVACLAYGGVAYVSRFVRTTLVEATSGDGGRAARARGLSGLRYVATHGLAQSAVPLLTLAGFLVPRLVAGSVLVERIFDVPGLGSLLFDAVLGRDVPVVLALTLLSGVATLAGVAMSDALCVVADPRVRRAS